MFRLIGILLVLGMVGCGQQVPPPVLATAPVAPAARTLPIRAVAYLQQASASTTPQKGMVAYEVKIAEFPDDQVASLGLTAFFASAQPANKLVREAVTNSPAMQFARAFTNVSLHLPSHSLAAGVCSEETAQNLVSAFMAMNSVDLLSLPKGQAERNRECDLSVQQGQTLVIGPPNADGQTRAATAPFGISTRLTSGTEGEEIHLEVKSTFALFRGYKAPAQTIPEPIIELRAMGLRTTINRGEVLVLGSPVLQKTETHVERVPYLSAIPIVGERLFTKRQVKTNNIRNLMFVWVSE